jgi:signal transduction histidine kinase
LPFAALACLAEASLVLPPGPMSLTEALISAFLLAATGAAIYFAPWQRLPEWLSVIPVLAYTGSVLPLMLSAGGPNSGTIIVLLIPLLWTALYHRRWESACATFAVLAVLLTSGLIPDPTTSPAVVLARRVSFWAAAAAMVAFAGHGLRARAARAQAATERAQDRVHELSILADRDRMASALHDTVVQRLFAAGLSLQGVSLLAGMPEVTRRIDEVVASLDESIKLLRQAIFGLEQGLPEQGMRRTILDVSNELTPSLGMAPEVTLEGPIDEAVTAVTALQLLAALREGLANSGARAGASQVAVSVTASEGNLTLTITDNGSRWATRSSGDTGPPSLLNESAARLQGTVQVTSGPHQTRLIWQVPLASGRGPGQQGMRVEQVNGTAQRTGKASGQPAAPGQPDAAAGEQAKASSR